MARIITTINWANSEVAMKEYLELDTGPHASDERLKLWLNNASALADQHVDRDFLDEDGLDVAWLDDPQHAGIPRTIYDAVGIMLGLKGRAFGLQSVRTRDLGRGYSMGGFHGGVVTIDRIWESVCGALSPSLEFFT